MILQTNEFKNTPPVNNQQGQGGYGFGGYGGYGNPGAYGFGGFNPFMSGQFGNYFGYTGGGGVPPASSGYRYRNKRGQLQNQINTGIEDNATNDAIYNLISDPGAKAAFRSVNPEIDVESLQGELGTLKSDRNSYMATGVASGLPGIINSIGALYDNQKGRERLKTLNPDNYVSPELRKASDKAALGSYSAQTADAAQRKSDINQNTVRAMQNAAAGATNAEQTQQTALMAQNVANNALNNLGREGLVSKSGREQYADNLAMKVGSMRQKVKDEIEKQDAILREAQSRNRSQLIENIGMTALTMGV
jgi:hypothetical protein